MARKSAGIRRRKNGLLEDRFTYNKVRYSVYGTSNDECKDKEIELMKNLAEGIYKSGKKLTVSEYFDRWLDARQGTVKETTIRTNKVLFKAVSEAEIDAAGQMFGSLKLTAVETQNIRALQNVLRQERTVTVKGKRVTRKGCSTRTINDAIALLKSVFQTAVDERIISWNPAKGVKSLKRTEPAVRETMHRALEREETTRFLQQAKASGSCYYNLYVFLLHTGCRIGEAGALIPGDIVTGKNSQGVTVSRTITRTEDGGYMIGSETKTAAGRRYIPLDPDAQEAIENQRKQNEMLNPRIAGDAKKPIFVSPYGSLVKSSSVNQDIKSICEKAGIDRFTVHAFRATFCTRCIEDGVQPKTLMTILGHTDISMTMSLYGHTMNATIEEQMKGVSFG